MATTRKTSSLTGIKAAVKEQAKEQEVAANAPVVVDADAPKVHVKKIDKFGRAYATGKRIVEMVHEDLRPRVDQAGQGQDHRQWPFG